MRIVIFGVGGFYRERKHKIPAMWEIVAFLDNNPKLQGQKMDGVLILAPGNVSRLSYDKIVLMSASEEAMKDQTVAMVSSGDSGIYGMAGIIYQVADEKNADIEIETVPGVTAASAAASVLGAPLMHDFAVISLSDLMTPLDLIRKRVDCAGQGDLIVCLYNPKSRKRTGYVEQAADILMKYRKPRTPVGIVRNAGRKDETMDITTLEELKDAEIDMFSIVIIGNSQTYVKNARMITPRGYSL